MKSYAGNEILHKGKLVLLLIMDYQKTRDRCMENTRLSRVVLDEFLIYYAAEKESLVPQMDARLKKYRKAASDIQVSYINFLKSEFIAHRIFGIGGSIRKYLGRPEIRKLPEDQLAFLEFHSRRPWRFSFAEVKNTPADAFFEMEDVITGEEYLLYSPGMEATEKEQAPRLWFNLIADNGHCWQTFGLIIPFKSFTADDIFFFATEMVPEIQDGETLMKVVEKDPFPFFMLLSGSNLPVIAARGYETRYCQASDRLENFSSDAFEREFTAVWNKGVFRLTPRTLGEFPHFAVVYYDEKKKELLRFAATKAGFEGLTLALSKSGISLAPDADVIVTPGMLSTASKILNRKIDLDSYGQLFSVKKQEGETESLKRLNHFMQLALPYYNARKEPDISKLADEASMDPDTAADVWEQVKKNLGG